MATTALPSAAAATKFSRASSLELTEQRAWAIATSVAAPLVGHVELASTGQETREFALTRTNDWLQITIPDVVTQRNEPNEPHKQATRAWPQRVRDACLVWHLLASCGGFSGQENPCFWKKVIDSLIPDDGASTCTRLRPSVDDAKKFFTGPSCGGVFPRVRLAFVASKTTKRRRAAAQYGSEEDDSEYEDESDEYDDEDKDVENESMATEEPTVWIQRAVQVFAFGVGGSRVRPSTGSPSVAALMKELLIHADPNRYVKTPLDLEIHLARNYPIRGLACTVSSLLAELEEPQQQPSNEPLLGPSERFKTHREFRELTKIIKTCAITIPELEITLNEYASEETWRRLLFASLRIGGDAAGSKATVQALDLQLLPEASHLVEVLFSALPYAAPGTVETLRLSKSREFFGSSTGHHRPATMERQAWLWLAYALFHPQNTSNQNQSWKSLDLNRVDISEGNAEPLQDHGFAARCLYRLVYEQPRPAAGVIGSIGNVTLRAGASLYRSSNLQGSAQRIDQAYDATALIVKDTHTVTALPAAVCVVLPGYGSLWVAKKDILSCKTRPATRDAAKPSPL